MAPPRSGLRFLQSAAVAASLLAPSAGWAFSAQGHHWPAGTTISYRIDPNAAPGVDDGSDLAAIRSAFHTWETVACSSLRFQEEAWMEPRLVQNDGLNRIFWVKDQGQWPADQRTTIALTFTFFRTTDKIITDADIFTNGEYYTWTTDAAQVSQLKVDVETVMFHEIGHFFGLDHSQDPAAAMFPTNNKPAQRSPAIDDVNGICSLYPNGQPPPGGIPTGGGAVGQPCNKHEDCASRKCAVDGTLNVTYCTQSCSTAQPDSCPVGYSCDNTSEGQLCLAPAVVDELCDQCTSGNQCTSGLCMNVPNYNFFQPFCTRACDPTNGVPGQCPNNFTCVVVANQGQTGGVCAPTSGVCNPNGKGGHDEPCYANGGCKPQHICLEYLPGTGINYCYYQCAPQLAGQSCGEASNAVCLNIPALPNRAACIDIAGPGRPCMPEQCTDGSICAYDDTAGPDSAICYQLCPAPPASCPANSQCQNKGTNENPLLLCIPQQGFLPIGAICASDNECETRQCRTYGKDRLCTQPCAETDPMSCPSGLKCVPNPQVRQGFCWPTSYTDANAQDLSRKVNLMNIPNNYCACDTTNACDPGCACDKDCTGGCSCEASTEGSVPGALWGLLLGGALWAWRGRARRA